jgi:Xaa-Pro aminopeptidase
MDEALTITAAMHSPNTKISSSRKIGSAYRGIAEGVALAQQGRLSYQAICTIQGQTLHNNEYHRKMKEGDMLLCDIGAESTMGYAGDITRTYPVSLKLSPAAI